MAFKFQEMIILQEEVANLYARICQTIQQKPSRIMTLEHIQQQQKQGCDENVAAVRNILAKLRTAKGCLFSDFYPFFPLLKFNNLSGFKLSNSKL